MSHYQPVMHDVLDKYERAPGIINADITEFNPTRNYRLILSVSTFEHIGFDEETNVGSAEKIQAAIQHCRGFLEPGGELIITAATGYNPEFDALFRDNRVGAAQVTFLKRRSYLKWDTCDEATALGSRYHHPFAFGNAIVVAKFGP
jgi:cyclopropane fatty-acyl-phospholipid synthase-like methyltransferase